MKVQKISILKNPYFILSLVILILNDHVFKYIFDNWITGKLSDFTGLFMFPLLILAFFPKLKKHIFPLTALLFTLWKSELSEGFIHWWNSTPLFNIGRVVDYTDLIAIAILPFSSFVYAKKNTFKSLKMQPSLIAVISFIAICATSYSDYNLPINDTYTFQKSKEELFTQINYSDSTGIFGENISINDSLELSKDTNFYFIFSLSDIDACGNYLNYETNIYGDSNSCSIDVLSVTHGNCGGGILTKQNKEDRIIIGEAIHIFIEKIASKLE